MSPEILSVPLKQFSRPPPELNLGQSCARSWLHSYCNCWVGTNLSWTLPLCGQVALVESSDFHPRQEGAPTTSLGESSSVAPSWGLTLALAWLHGCAMLLKYGCFALLGTGTFPFSYLKYRDEYHSHRKVEDGRDLWSHQVQPCSSRATQSRGFRTRTVTF